MTFADYVEVVEHAFRLHAQGGALEPALAHVDADGGEFHIKAGGLRGDPPYFAVKVNGGFFQNRAKFGLPNIQGLILLSRADNGTPLAAMDSMEITIQRTGAATAVAAKYLARAESRVCTVCGCGTQGRIQVRAIAHVLPIEKVFAWSINREEAASFASQMTAELGIDVVATSELRQALRRSDVCVTCTPSKAPLVEREDIPSGMFIAAVGSDSPDKQELDAGLVAAVKVVADLRTQVVAVGETHHAIAAGLMRPDQIHAEIGEIIAGKVSGRTTPEEIIIYDSTGTALQDVAAAAAVYTRACSGGRGIEWNPSQ
jgi:ornithine cyclodeaminase/alanine dehydrogenase